ncbi:MAG: hypothetical protein DID92_2727743064 [Candidatus Nitrotoga sp. SPKER]|nr:MAG: hypothetical protein DID92_2727743064 [Candidatus Nitrotoga sp. SPKER]
MNQKSTEASAPTPTLSTLKETINAMDGLAQTGFSQIEAIAKLAMAYMEMPEAYRHTEILAVAFEAIWNKAFEMNECISGEARFVGCERTDQGMLRRYAARAAERTEAGGSHE